MHEVLKSTSKEVSIIKGNLNITINEWSNLEGATIIVFDDNLVHRMCGSFTWDEINLISLAISESRCN